MRVTIIMRITLTFRVASAVMLVGLLVVEEAVLSKETLPANIFFFLKAADSLSMRGMPRLTAVAPASSALFLFVCWLLSCREDPLSLSSFSAPPLTVDIIGMWLLFLLPPIDGGDRV